MRRYKIHFRAQKPVDFIGNAAFDAHYIREQDVLLEILHMVLDKRNKSSGIHGADDDIRSLQKGRILISNVCNIPLILSHKGNNMITVHADDFMGVPILQSLGIRAAN